MRSVARWNYEALRASIFNLYLERGSYRMWQVVLTYKGLPSERAAKFLAAYMRRDKASELKDGDVTIEIQEEKP